MLEKRRKSSSGWFAVLLWYSEGYGRKNRDSFMKLYFETNHVDSNIQRQKIRAC
jgi:hypothetical protein